MTKPTVERTPAEMARRREGMLGISGEQFADWEYRLGDWPDGSGPRWISNPVHTAVEEAIKAEAIRPYVEAAIVAHAAIFDVLERGLVRGGYTEFILNDAIARLRALVPEQG